MSSLTITNAITQYQAEHLMARNLAPLTGLMNANIQALLIAAGQNLKRFLAATGWGWRHAPCEPFGCSEAATAALGRLRVIIDPVGDRGTGELDRE